VALASLVSLVAAACSGEHANSPRDASALAGAGGKGGAGSSGNAGTSGDGGSTGVGTAGTGGDGGGGTGGAGAGGTGGIRPTGTGIDGSTCSTGGDCMSSWCVDTICCATECAGACMVCNATGVCEPAMDGTNPRGMCAVTGATSCGTTGVCNGSGACRYHPSGQLCDSTPSCDDTSSAVVTKRVCNGTGACVPNMSQSCSPYGCASAACRTTCAADSDCAPSSFCSSSICYPSAGVNLAGNGDLETGTQTGWFPANGGGAVALSAVASSGVANSGGYSIVGTNRTMAYHGPAYTLPTGPGKYIITAWAFQRDLAKMPGALQVRLSCLTNTNPGYYVDVAYGVTMSQNIWTSFSSTIDTTKFGVDCLPTGAAPGLVRSASLYLNHPPEVPSPLPEPLPRRSRRSGHRRAQSGRQPELRGGPGRRVEPERRVIDGDDRHHRRPRRYEEPAPERAIDPPPPDRAGFYRPAPARYAFRSGCGTRLPSTATRRRRTTWSCSPRTIASRPPAR
jgi:hypothetical protein